VDSARASRGASTARPKIAHAAAIGSHRIANAVWCTKYGATARAVPSATSEGGTESRFRKTATATASAASPSMLTIRPAGTAATPARIRPAMGTNSIGK
jgi:hypothetical protein